MKKKLLAAVTAVLLTAAVSASALAAEQTIGALNKAPRAMEQETPYITQCELGSAVADAFRAAGQTEIALVKTDSLSNDLVQGNLTRADVERVLASEEKLAAASMTVGQLYALLEQAVAQITVDPQTEHIDEQSAHNPAFCQISGFTFRYDASAPAGERVVFIRMDDGTELSRSNESERITVTAEESLLAGMEYRGLSVTNREALCNYVSTHTDLPEGEQERISVIGARENTIVGMFPRWLIAPGVAILALLLAVSGMRLKRHKEEFD